MINKLPINYFFFPFVNELFERRFSVMSVSAIIKNNLLWKRITSHEIGL